MSIDAKHSYRFGFLKSEHWQATRKIALARQKARCRICGKKDWSNDVHHVKYRKNLKHLWRDLLVLCRGCHSIVHFVLEHRKRMGANDNKKKTWRNVRRSAIRIRKLSKQTSPEVALHVFRNMYKTLESNRAL
jgi:5-methylcytosine-specific restriction endonuclease McrA